MIYLNHGATFISDDLVVNEVNLSVTFRWIRSLPTRANRAPPTNMISRRSTLESDNAVPINTISTLDWVLEERALQGLPKQGPTAPRLKPPKDHEAPLEMGSV